MTTQSTPIPDLLLEKLVAGELQADKARELRARIEADPTLAARVAELERSNAEVLAQYPASEMSVRIGHRVRAHQAAEAQKTPRRSAWWIAGPALAAATAVAIIVAVGIDTSPTVSGGVVEPPDSILFKGDPSLAIHLQASPRTVALADGDMASAGDNLQVLYNARGAAHGVILSIDGRGTTTLHFPSSEDASTALKQGGEVALEHAYELDDAPSFERFFFVWSNAPIQVGEVVRAAEQVAHGKDAAAASLILPSGQRWGQKSMLLRKVKR